MKTLPVELIILFVVRRTSIHQSFPSLEKSFSVLQQGQRLPYLFRKCGIHSVNSERRAAIDVLFYAVFEARSKQLKAVSKIQKGG